LPQGCDHSNCDVDVGCKLSAKTVLTIMACRPQGNCCESVVH